MTVRFEIRSLIGWDRPYTSNRKSSGQFRAKWPDTIEHLKTEVDYLGGTLVVAQIAVAEGQIRRDGMLKVGAKVTSPAVKISFESVHGPLTYATDVYDHLWPGTMPGWQANIRAIGLGLEALRAVDRYGITRSGEQYRGFTALSDKPAGHDDLTVGEATRVLADAAGIAASTIERAVSVLTDGRAERPFVSEVSVRESRGVITAAYRAAASKAHPDHGGNEQVFMLITRARDVLLAAAR